MWKLPEGVMAIASAWILDFGLYCDSLNATPFTCLLLSLLAIMGFLDKVLWFVVLCAYCGWLLTSMNCCQCTSCGHM